MITFDELLWLLPSIHGYYYKYILVKMKFTIGGHLDILGDLTTCSMIIRISLILFDSRQIK